MNGIMKKNFMMIALASVLMMPVSCTKNELEAPKGPAAGELTFVAYAEGGDSKTTLNEEDGSVAWAIGDQIKFDYELEDVAGEAVLSSVLAEGDIVEGAATFTAALPEAFTMSTKEYDGESRHMYVTYPASIETDYSSASEFLVTVPAEQDGTFANASIALAKWDPANPTAPLQFKNLCGLLQIEIADDRARKIVLTSSTDIAGKMSVGFGTGVPAVKTSKNAVPVKEVTVNVGGAGTYYVAVLPGELEDVYVAIYDEADALLGDRTANNAIPVARKQIRKLGTIGTGFSDRYYVKTTAAGSGDGSSWDNAADLTGLKALVATNVVKKVYVAAGTYTFSGNFGSNADAAANFSVYGGYPSDATGLSLAGRDIVNNATVFDGGHTETTTADKRIWVIQKGTFLFNGITFQNAYRATTADIGSAVILEGPVNATFTECVFQNNTNLQTPKEGTLGGGALRLASSSVSVFNNCKFLNNTTDYDGGAVYVSSTASATFNDCEFSGNIAGNSGGAVYHASSSSVTFNNTQFTGNESNYMGSAAYVMGKGAFNMTGCTLSENVEHTYDATVFVDESATLDIDNCVFSANTAKRHAGAISAKGTVNAVNCDFENNTSGTSGGAIWMRNTGVLKCNLCTFRSNQANGTANTNGGGAINASETAKVFLNRCFLAENKDKYNAYHIYSGSSTYVGLNNCVISGPFGTSNTQGSLLQIKGSNVIVNTTMYCQIGQWGAISLGSKTENGCRVINDIIINNSGSSYSFYSTSYYMQIYNTIYSASIVTNTSYKHTFTDCLSGAINKSETVAETNGFPNTTNGWTKKSKGTRFDLDGDRYIYVYEWDGTTSLGEVKKNSLADIKTLIYGTANIGSDFLTWLESEELKENGVEALAMDIRGVSRNTAAMWPGSYEDATATAGLESLNVK